MRRAEAGRLGAQPPQTYLFIGPPGVGKSLIARAAAGELGMSVINLEPAVVLSRWPGETERAVAEIFRVANHVAPCLVLLEDIDAVAPVRSAEGAAQMSLRLVAKLLREIREARRTRGLVIIATTERPELVDPAVVKGFEVTVPFALPTPKEREEIFAMQLGPDVPGMDLSMLAAVSEGLSGGEIEAVCRRAAALALDGPLQMRHLEEALQISVTQRAA
jgi:transitional endoplasmic reticulum ATPase